MNEAVVRAPSARPLGQLLLGRGVIAAEQLDRALEEQRRGQHRKLLGEILIELRDCTEEQIAEALADSYGIPFVRLSPRLADPKAMALLPRAFVESKLAMPLFLVDGTLTIAVAEPADIFLIEQAQRLAGRPVQVVAATAREIRATLAAMPAGDETLENESAVDDPPPGAFRLDRPAGASTPVSPSAAEPDAAHGAGDRLLRHCLYAAVKQGASAIHFEPTQETPRVRFRVDGMMAEKLRPAPRAFEALSARLKGSAGLDPNERRRPQAGRLRAVVEEKAVEFEIATAPGRFGEQIVVHVLQLERPGASLEKLGFGYDMLKQWRRLLGRPGGLLLATGPDDSGKRTTLYSSLDARGAAGLNLCAIESPVGRPMPGVNQYAVDPASGFTAPTALAAVLGQDPDVLMITDLPDAESARLAARAALGGKLILAGLCAADAPSGLARLLGFGLEPYLVASSVAALLSQRLVRRLCPACREPYEPAGAEKRLLEKTLPGRTTLYRPKGCQRCQNQGYAGRIGLFELLVPDDAMTDALCQGASLADLRRGARAAGMTSLRADGFEKARAGVTTLEEVCRVTG